jgi:hypothetical protein
MTDERMTQGDVRLREELDDIATGICRRLHPHRLGTCMDCRILVDHAVAPVVERIVAARVGEVVEPLRELVTLKDGPRGEDYERRKPLAWEAARAALRAADAPVPTVGTSTPEPEQ